MPEIRMEDGRHTATVREVNSVVLEYTFVGDWGQVVLRGDVKWDHCSNWEFGGSMMHLCEADDLKDYDRLIRWAYEDAAKRIATWDA